MKINLLSQISAERSAFGASRGDYEAYQRHCSRRVAALRSKLGLKQKSKKGTLFTAKRVDVTTVKSDKLTQDHILLVLFDAERNWAAAMREKSQQTAQARHHLLGKLGRASQHARALFNLLERQDSVLPIGEAKAYELFLVVSQQFERASNPALCLKLLEHTEELLHALVTKAPANTQASALALLDYIDPMKRISHARQQSEASQVSVDLPQEQSDAIHRTLKAMQQLPSATESVTLTLHFRDQQIVVKHAKLSNLIQHAENSAKNKLSPRKNFSVAAYEKVLERYGLAEDLARRLVEENELAQGRAASVAFESLSAPLHATLSYLSYRLLTLRIARDTLIISRSLDANRANRQPNHQKPKSAHQLERKQARTLATAVKLYEALISSFEALRELDVVEADADLAQEIEARLEVTQARRCLHTAQSYALLKLWSEALVANEHASLALRSAGSALSVLSQNEESAMGDLQRPIKVQDLTKLAEEVSKQKQQIHKRAFKADEKEDKVAGQQPKIFDIAFNYVTSFDMDGLVAKSQGVEPGPKHVEEKKIAPLAASEKQQQQEEDAPAAKKGGFWGLFSRS